MTQLDQTSDSLKYVLLGSEVAGDAGGNLEATTSAFLLSLRVPLFSVKYERQSTVWIIS
jgi:hypothetical protein